MWNTKGREIIIIKHACMQKKKRKGNGRRMHAALHAKQIKAGFQE
jgi:hypothetical protein